MKRRIEQLLNGKFEYEPAKLRIAPQKLSVHARPEAAVHGSFRLEAEDHRRIRGVLYTSSPRILCDPAEFQGLECEIHYQVDCSGFREGTEEQGVITICSDLGEYTLPYEIVIEAQQTAQALPEVSGPEQLASLAQEDFQQAHRVFSSPAFRRLLRELRPELLGVYDGLRVRESGPAELEEFLIGSGCKEAVRIKADQDAFFWEDLPEPTKQTIRITKNTWGYQEICISSDARFLRPEKRRITTGDFAGSTFDLNLVLDTNLMHAGNNYARLTLAAGSQTLELAVTARRTQAGQTGRQNHIRRIMAKELESLYVRFRLKKIDLTTWTERSVSVLNSYKRAGGEDPFADLFLIQLYFADGKKQKAFHMLEALEERKYRLGAPECYGFYLYLSTFFYQEASYVDRVEEEVSRLFSRDRSNWKLLWILLYLQERFLNDDQAKFEAVAEQFDCGCRSRIMYLEAYQILKKNPFLMRRLGPFELRLLRFAREEEALTAEVIRQAANLAEHYPAYDRDLYETLSAGYRLYPSDDLVKAICLLLMKGNRKESCFFPWYEKGVKSGLRITGLYEYYMESTEHPDLQAMPQVVRMYFAYDNALDYRRRAEIYRRIIENRDSDAQTYRSYRAAMGKFALDQLETTRVSDDLAVIYREFLTRAALTRPAAQRLTRVLFTYEVTCAQPGIRQVIAHSVRQKSEQSAAFADGRAYLQIYDPDSVLIVEDQQGRRRLASGICSVRRMLEDDEMLSWCAGKAGEFPGLLLYICIQCRASGGIRKETLPYFREACESEALSEEFRAQLRAEVMEYYVNHLRDESLPEFLERIPYLEYVRVDKAALITLLAEEGRCTDAFALLDAYGTEGIALVQLVRICSRMVLELEFEENAMLVSLCHYCFASGKYDDKLLRYLLLYYEGSVQDMKAVWQAAVRFDLDTMLLEEKIITMILFTQSGTQGSEAIFESYLRKMGRKKLCSAYANLKSYEYFVRGIPVADPVFRYLERECMYLSRRGRQQEQEQVCRLALLQYYAQSVSLTQDQRKLVADMLEEFSEKGMRFAFWRRFDAGLLEPYQMEGRVFVEYACNPASTVTVFYRLRGREKEYHQEIIKNYFEGIFVREFTLFEGDELECYLQEELGEIRKETDIRILRAPSEDADAVSKYGMLNRILRSQNSPDAKKQAEEMESCLTLEYLAEQVFTLI